MLESIARSSTLLTILIAISVPILHAQQTPTPAPAAAPAKVPTFDVISVKPNNTGTRAVTMGYTPDGIHATNIPVQTILEQAFALNDDEIFGAPG